MRIEIRLNGEARETPDSLNIAQMLEHFEFPKDRVAVERNRAIVPKPQWESVSLGQGDEVEVVHFVGGGSGNDAPFVIAGRAFELGQAGGHWRRENAFPGYGRFD